jgi:hypothetical protein
LVKGTFPKAGVSNHDQVEDIYPATVTQEGILLSQLKHPGAYVPHAMFEVTHGTISSSPVDARRLADSWGKVVDRHAVLRTVFVDSLCPGSIFNQLVLKESNNDIVILNCEDEEEALRILDESTLKAGDHPKPLHQFTICVTVSGKVYLKMEMSHAIIDGGSAAILLKDLALAYDYLLPEGPGPLYSDYIQFTNRLEGEAEFWKDHLRGIQPCYLPRLNHQSEPERRLYAADVQFSRFPELHVLCEANDVTLANVMHAAWGLVLSAYTGSDDICFGYLSAGRDAPVNGIQNAVGLFINMLCCRIRVRPEDSVVTLLQSVQQSYIDSLPHQHCSLAKVQHELGLGGKPLYNTAISTQNNSKASDAQEGSLHFKTLESHDPSEVSSKLHFSFITFVSFLLSSLEPFKFRLG